MLSEKRRLLTAIQVGVELCGPHEADRLASIGELVTQATTPQELVGYEIALQAISRPRLLN